MQIRKRKIICGVLFFILLFNVGNVFAQAQENISVFINNELIKFDVEPQIVNGTTFVPIRAVCEKLGADVYCFDLTKECLIVKNEIKLILSTNTPYPNMLKITHEDSQALSECEWEDIELDVMPFIKDGRTMLPLRAICEALDTTVIWKPNNVTKNHRIEISAPVKVMKNQNEDKDFFDFYCQEILKYIMTEEPYGKWSFRNSGYCEYEFFADYTYNEKVFGEKGTWSFDGKLLKIYDEKNQFIAEYKYLSNYNAFQNVECDTVGEQDYVDANGVYHPTIYRPSILYRLTDGYENILYNELTIDFWNAVKCYTYAYNNSFPITYDISQTLPGSFNGVGSLCLVTSHNTIESVKTQMRRYLSDDLLSRYWADGRLKEVNGKLYYQEGSVGWITYNTDIFDTSFYINEYGDFVVFVKEYGSGDNYIRDAVFTFRKFPEGYKIINVR